MRELEAGAMPDDVLLDAYDQALQRRGTVAETIGRLEQEIFRRMEAHGALAIPSDTWVCELVRGYLYDQARFIPLKEIFTPGDLDSCCVPAHEETIRVAERWDTTKVKALARRYGEKAHAIVETARLPDKPRLKFGPKRK